MKDSVMWTIQEAVAFARAIHPLAYARGWNIHLGGGLLTKSDTSAKDADFLLMPRYQVVEHTINGLIAALAESGWTPSAPPYTLPHREIHTLAKNGKVAELIFAHLEPENDMHDK